MKKYLLLLFILVSCTGPKYIPYHSTANIPSSSTLIKTDMSYIKGKIKTFGVVVAVDKYKDKNLSYILLAPAKRADLQKLENLDLVYSSNLNKTKAKELVSIIDSVLLIWDIEKTFQEGTFFEFMSSPEHEIKQISANVEVWDPNLKFTYNLTESGSKAVLIIGEIYSTIKITYSFDLNHEDLIDFKDQLEQAINQLNARGY